MRPLGSSGVNGLSTTRRVPVGPPAHVRAATSRWNGVHDHRSAPDHSAADPGAPGLTVRRVAFEFPDDLDPAWTPRYPECAMAANSVSLLMPFVEPYVVRSVGAVRDQLDQPLHDVADDFCRQELQHQRQHRRFNAAVTRDSAALRRIERGAKATYGWLSRRGSSSFHLAFAAGSETIAFAIARWTESHFRVLFDDADEVVSTLFLWHLAEEVEHKTVAFDVYRAVGGSRLKYLAAALLSAVLLGVFTIAGTTVMAVRARRAWLPVTWFRLTKWSITLTFEILADVFASAMPRHHPSDFTDPVLLSSWLRYFDPATASMPLWTATIDRPIGGTVDAAADAALDATAPAAPLSSRSA